MPNTPVPAHRARVLGYAATVFLSSAILLVLEIVAGRLIAPYVGVSLYTWTSIIGIILAGLSLGNWLGGIWADRGATDRAAGVVLAAGGVYCILSLALATWAGRLVQAEGMTLLGASFTLAAILFLVPALLIGVVTPLLTTLALGLDPRPGHVVGRMNALAAVGSILGTFAAGYVLVQAFGSRALVLGCGLALLLLALPYLRGLRPVAVLALGLAVLGSGSLMWHAGGLETSCHRESAYFCIRVEDQSAEAPVGEARGLVLDHLLHGINHLEIPELLIAPYVHGLDELAHAHFGELYDLGLDWFFLGGGAYTQPRAVRVLSPASRVTVAELDPAVTETARDELAVDLNGIRVLHQDARLALAKQAPGSLDLVIGDVFHDVAVPYHLTTREFAAEIHTRLGPGGLYAMNLVDAFPDPRLLKSVVATLRQVFRQVDVWMDGPPRANRITFIVTASDAPPLPDEIPARTGPARSWFRVTDMLDRFGVPMDRVPVLTDDYAPVEQLIAGLLTGSGS
ncbi:MAG: fused MFS/spermidine synthase [Chromatiaceae bacterium]